MLCGTFEAAERHQKALTEMSLKPVEWQVIEVDEKDLRAAVNTLTT